MAKEPELNWSEDEINGRAKAAERKAEAIAKRQQKEIREHITKEVKSGGLLLNPEGFLTVNDTAVAETEGTMTKRMGAAMRKTWAAHAATEGPK